MPSCHPVTPRTRRGQLRCDETRESRLRLARSRGVGSDGAFPLLAVWAPGLVLRGQSSGRDSQCIMKERPASDD